MLSDVSCSLKKQMNGLNSSPIYQELDKKQQQIVETNNKNMQATCQNVYRGKVLSAMKVNSEINVGSNCLNLPLDVC